MRDILYRAKGEDDYYTGIIMEIKYCPMCGRKLKDA